MFLPLYLLVMDWVFSLKLSYRIESLRIWEHLMYVLHVFICGDNGIFTWSTWCIFWWSTCGFSDLVNLWIGVGTRFRLDSPIETLGHSLKFFVLVWIDESEIVWCISYNHTREYLRWHWSIYVTLVFWLICILRCYFSTNSMIDRTERIASCYFTTDSWIDRSERITLRWFCTLQ